MQITSARNISSTAQILDGTIESADIKDNDVAAIDIATDAVGSDELADDAVDTNAIADNQVTDAKLADATQGHIRIYTTAGAPTTLAPGNDGEFLKTQGAGADPVWATAGGSSLEEFDKAPAAVGGSTTESTVWSKSIAANRLGTGNVIRGKIYIPDMDGDDSGTLTLRLKYGSTTVATITTTTLPTINMVGYIEFFLAADASASAQVGRILLDLQKTDTTSVERITAGGTATEDSTGALTLTITSQWSNTNFGWTTDDVIVELLKL